MKKRGELSFRNSNAKKKDKNQRGQLTIFIIVAVILLALILLIYFFFPGIITNLGITPQTPDAFIKNCMEDEINNNVEQISVQGGSLNPEHYILYNSKRIEYLCYTNEYYKTCVMQQPMLKSHIENEIKNSIEDETSKCFISLKENFEKQGFEVNLGTGETSVELLPKRIVVTLNRTLTLTKGESQRYEKFDIILNNNLYELTSIANSILNWEARYGDSETTMYMNSYHWLKAEKKTQIDGTTVYILTDSDDGSKLQFASRSVAWPPGYGLNEVAA
ncbi:MAG: hypothetical protein AABX28_01120 [Nanoarchaeota archaeon]